MANRPLMLAGALPAGPVVFDSPASPMLFFRRSESHHVHRAVALLTLLSFVVAAAPIPVPVMPLELSTAGVDEPFPCQGSRCGCRSAKQCWTACCCRKPSERKRWAEERKIRPPAYAVLHDPVITGVPVISDAQPVVTISRSCCAVSAAVAAGDPPARPPAASCCAQPSAGEAGVGSDDLGDSDYLLTIRALECRGLGHDLSAIAWFHWSPPVLVAHQRHFETLAQRQHDDRADSFSIDPATPPPRLG